VLRQLAPKFAIPQVIVFSSLASSIGGATLYSYAAANAYANAVARQASIESNVRWVSVEWDVWSNKDASRVPNSLREYAITYEEGFRLLSTVLGYTGVYHVCVTKRPSFEQLLALDEAVVGDHMMRAPEQEGGSLNQELTESMEEKVRSVMCQLLGISDIGFDDNFFDRGGDSLLAVQVAKTLTEKLELGCCRR